MTWGQKRKNSSLNKGMADFAEPTRDWKKIDEPHGIQDQPRFRGYLQDKLHDESDIREAKLRQVERKETKTTPSVTQDSSTIENALKWPTLLDPLTYVVAAVVTFWAAPVLMPEQAESSFLLVGYLSGAATSFGLQTVKDSKK